MLETAYNNYTNVNNGYDELFGYYVKYIERITPVTLQTTSCSTCPPRRTTPMYQTSDTA